MIVLTSEECDHSNDDNNAEGRKLCEHEEVLQARRDLHRVAVEPSQEADAKRGDQG